MTNPTEARIDPTAPITGTTGTILDSTGTMSGTTRISGYLAACFVMNSTMGVESSSPCGW